MVLNDHRQLEVTLGSLRQMCAWLQGDRASLAPELPPIVLIDSLTRSLSAHFVVEESDGYFGTVASERPALAERVARLTAEHGEMLETLGRLRVISTTEARWPELSAPLLELVAQLERHERAETELMREFFDTGD
jgi:hypothetical protein